MTNSGRIANTGTQKSNSKESQNAKVEPTERCATQADVVLHIEKNSQTCKYRMGND